MGDQKPSHPDNCVAHLGMEEKIKRVNDKFNLVIWLLGFLIALNGTQTIMIMNIKSDVNGVIIKFAGMEVSNKKLEEKIQCLELTDSQITDRLEAVERKLR